MEKSGGHGQGQEQKQMQPTQGTGRSSSTEREEKLEGLPIESSPYTQYKDLEDYKQQGYGAHGHLQPQPGRGAGATDAPTPSGATDTINRQGVP